MLQPDLPNGLRVASRYLRLGYMAPMCSGKLQLPMFELE